jgi:hypothetical protein
LALLLYLLLWMPPVQQKIKDIVLKELMKTTHNQMTIGELRFHPFNQLKLTDVYVEDLKGDTLLYAGKVSAGFNLFKLLDNHLLIQSVDLENFAANIQKIHPDSAFNFQFLIDAFASNSTDTTSSNLTIQIQDITLKEGRLRYDILSEPTLGDSLLDYNHIHIAHLQSDIDLNSIDIKKLDAAINQLSFVEKSGLNVTQFQVKARSKGEKYTLENLQLQLPHSQLNIPEAWLDGKSYDVKLGENTIEPADLKMFYSGLSQFPDNLTLAGEISGTLPQLNIPLLEAHYGKHLQLKLTGSMADLNQWNTTPVRLDLEQLAVDAYGIEDILHCFSEDKKQQLPVKLGDISLTGALEGTLPDLLVHLVAQSDRGAIHLDGNGGYDRDSGVSRFDASLHSDDFDVETLLQDTLFGLAALQLQAKGSVDSSGNINAEGNIIIDRFDFNGYSYNHIQADGAYFGDSIRLNLNSDDNNVDLKIKVLADMGKKTPGVKLYANVDCIYMDTLHFLSDYKDAFLTTLIQADVKGFNPEKMSVDLSLDSLSLYTDKGAFLEPHFKLMYQAGDSCSKRLNIASHIINARANGNFTYAGIMESLKETFPMLFPKSKRYPKKKDAFAENLNFRIGMNEINSLSEILELPRTLPDSILFIGKYNNDGQNLKLSTSAYTLFTQSDTTQLSLSLSNKGNNLAVIFNVDNKSSNYDLDGSIDAEVEFVPKAGSIVPDMNISLNPTTLVFNETDFDFNPAQIEIREGRYTFHNLSIDYAGNPNEYVKIDGVLSASREDSVTVDISQFQLATLFGAIKTDIPLSGTANGRIVARNLLSTPFLFAKGFTLNDIVYANNAIGNLSVSSGWSSERNGLALRATLNREGHPQSVVSGFVLPEKDSLAITANIWDVELEWLKQLMGESLYGLEGSVGANMKATGKISNPTLSGMAYFNNAQVGIKMLNTLYTINDSIYFNPDAIELKRFTILDENKHVLAATGKITHQQYSGFTPDISISLSDFLVLNNEQQTDSLLYGSLRINGLLNVKKNNKDWMVTGNITHSNDTKVMVNIPFSASTAQQYQYITYINTEGEDLEAVTGKTKKEAAFTLPLKINASLWLDPSLTVGAIFNPATRDAAQVTGTGMIKFSYDMNTSAISMSGDYEVASGNATLSLVNITKKTFTVQEGGKLVFKGDPLATTFDVTALYNVRADLASLDPSFSKIGLANTKVPVTCSLTAIGSIDKMKLQYNILLPNEQEDIQRKIDGLLYTDDLKIKEIAYLLAFGGFLPINSNSLPTGNGNIWTSLASSSITSQLNNLLSNVLSENWSIGTDLHAGDAGFENMDMDVNVSGQLFNNRLTINGTVGYHNSSNQMNNFTGDFDVEYKLIPSGSVVLKIYNTTNNQYYEQARTTQGAGIVYKREERTFRKLFDKFRKKKK